MTQGYLISSRALEIGVRLRCQRLHVVFIGSARKKRISSAIFEDRWVDAFFFFVFWIQGTLEREEIVLGTNSGVSLRPSHSSPTTVYLGVSINLIKIIHIYTRGGKS